MDLSVASEYINIIRRCFIRFHDYSLPGKSGATRYARELEYRPLVTQGLVLIQAIATILGSLRVCFPLVIKTQNRRILLQLVTV